MGTFIILENIRIHRTSSHTMTTQQSLCLAWQPNTQSTNRMATYRTARPQYVTRKMRKGCSHNWEVQPLPTLLIMMSPSPRILMYQMPMSMDKHHHRDWGFVQKELQMRQIK
jgi:hypothetical protein